MSGFRDPVHGHEVRLVEIAASELNVIPHQRKPSGPHVRRLAQSMKRVGFVAPLIVVRSRNTFYIIDGQHRFLAGKEAGLERFPCLLIPERFSNRLMELNVEKQMNLREKCYVALNVYRAILEEEPGIPENDGRVLDSIEAAYYVTVGLTYEATPRFSGSAFEPVLKKADTWTDLALAKAERERRRRSGILQEAHGLVMECVGRLKKLNINHPFLYKEVVAFANPVKRKRVVEGDFDGLFARLRAKLEELREDPARMRSHKFGAGVVE